MSARLLGLLAVLVLLGSFAIVGFGGGPEQVAPVAPKPAPVPALAHQWPPSIGIRYPYVDLRTVDGKPFDFASLEGKVLLLETVGLQSPGSIGFNGIKRFGGQMAQRKLRSLDTLLEEHGIDRDHPDLCTVHLLFYDSMQKAPSLERAQLWADETGLAKRENAIVLVGDKRYVKPATLRQIPGFQLVDRSMLLRVDAGGNNAPDNIYSDLLPRLAKMLGSKGRVRGEQRVGPNVPTVPIDDDAAALFAHLAARDFAAADDEFARLRRAGRADGRFAERAITALQFLVVFPPAAELIDEWCEQRPTSLGAHLLSGLRWIDRAWSARSDRLASKVTERGWQLFRDRLDLAQKALDHAHMLDPKQPFASAFLVTVGTGKGWPIERIRSYFDRAVEIDASCVTAYSRLLHRLMPRWGGSFQEMVDLIKDAHKRTRSDPATEWLIARFHVDVAESSEIGVSYLERNDIRDRLGNSLRRLEKAYPNSSAAWCVRAKLARLQGRRKTELEALQKAGDLGAGRQAMLLGFALRENGDSKRSFEWFVRASLAGSLQAYESIGWCLATGEGVAQDFERARKWFEAGAKCGDTGCMFGLGTIYERGNGVPIDRKRALDWYYRAAVAEPKAELAATRLLEKHPELVRSGK